MDKKKICMLWGALGLAGLLCGCTAPEPEPSVTAQTADTPEQAAVRWLADDAHAAFQVGDFWVTLEHTEEQKTEISVWNPADLSDPLQTMEQEMESYAFGQSQVVDANFDGYPDFGCLSFQGNQPQYWNFWLWDEEQGKFVEEPALAGISAPQFDAATQVISGYARGGWAGLVGTYSFYQWEDGELVCIRRTESTVLPSETGEGERVLLTVEDRVDGALTEVVRQEYDMDSRGWLPVEEAWHDLYYHGE